MGGREGWVRDVVQLRSAGQREEKKESRLESPLVYR